MAREARLHRQHLDSRMDSLLDSLRRRCLGRTRGSPEVLEGTRMLVGHVVLFASCRGWTFGDAEMAPGEWLPMGI
jgi:hypothetical protein